MRLLGVAALPEHLLKGTRTWFEVLHSVPMGDGSCQAALTARSACGMP